MGRLATVGLVLLLLGVGVCVRAARRTAPSLREQQLEAAATPSGFVYVPGGEFLMGTDDPEADSDAQPAHRQFLPSFYIGRCEVTHAEWKRFRPEHRIPAGYGRHPITNVSLEDAGAYCRFVGGRLPTDAEWEKAARGTDGRLYPWGDLFLPERANLRHAARHPSTACLAPGVRRGLKRVDAHPDGASPYGALNMAGNAWEWVSDAYQGNPKQRIIRGGAVGYGERAARTYNRGIEGAGVT